MMDCPRPFGRRWRVPEPRNSHGEFIQDLAAIIALGTFFLVAAVYLGAMA